MRCYNECGNDLCVVIGQCVCSGECGDVDRVLLGVFADNWLKCVSVKYQ